MRLKLLCLLISFHLLLSVEPLKALPADQFQAPSDSTSTAAGLTSEIKVNPLGWFSLPESLVVTGSVVFDNEEIRKALSSHWEVMLSAHPQVDRREFATVVSRAALEGFYSSGYINARVFATYSNDRLFLDVIDGDRASSSRVEVEGAVKISSRLIEASLEAVTPEDNLSYDHSARNNMLQQVKNTYASAGYLFPEVSMGLKPGSTSTEALVLVMVENEGPLCRLGNVKFVGLKDQNEDGIKSYANLTRDEILTSERVKEISSLLYESGRFTKVFVSPVKPEGEEPTTLEITLTEAKDCPQVNDVLSLTESSILKLGSWFNSFSSSPKELLLNANIPGGMKVVGVMSPKKGVLFNVDSELASSFRFLWTDQSLSAIDSILKRRCTIPMNSGQVEIHLHVVPSGEEESPFSLKASVTYHGDREGNSPLVYDTSFAPVAFLSFAGSCKILECRMDEGKVTLKLSRKGNVIDLNIDSITGCPQSLAVSRAEDGVELFSLSATEGGFDVLESIHKRSHEKCQESFEAANPFRSGGTFVTETFLERYCGNTPIVDEAKKFSVKCLAVPILSSVDTIFRDYDSPLAGPLKLKEGLRFSVPAGKLPQGLGAIVIGPLSSIASSDLLLPPLSWPRVLSRGLLAYYSGRPQFASVWFGNLGNSTDIGPLGYFAIGKILSYVNRELAAKYHSRALEVVSLTGFKKDIDFVCSVKPLSSLVHSIILSIVSIDRSTLDAFIRTFVPEAAVTILDLYDKALKVNTDESLRDILNSLSTSRLENEFKTLIKP